MANVAETLLRIQGEKSPLLGLLEGFAGGVSSAQDSQYARAKAILDIQKQREEIEQRRQEQERKAQIMQMFQQDMERKTEENTVQNFSGVQKASPVLPSQKGQRIWSVDASGNPSYKQRDFQIVEPNSLEGLAVQKVKQGEMSLDEAYRQKNRGQQSGIPKPPPGYRFTADGAALEAIPGGPAEAKIDKAKTAIDTTLELYETARQGLLSGLEGSITGPVLGRIPAVTAKQQIAVGGVSAMAPVLKQLFRVAGEGVFTDRDQQILIDMIPTRTALPEARKAMIENIDAIVKSKLGRSATAAGGGSAVPEVGGTFNGEKVLKVERID
jgi:hypothetical protein